jgi:hypothetical protein
MCRIPAVLLALALAMPAAAAFSFLSRTAEQLALAYALPAAAADESGAEARARVIAPFVDGRTISVVHVDLSRIDADTLLNWAVEVGQLEKEEIEGPKRLVSGWRTDFTKAGGKEFYVVVSPTDLPMELPLVVVPLAAGADEDSVRRSLNRVKVFQQFRFEKSNHALIGGSDSARKRLRDAGPAPRPELARAFSRAGDTTVQVLLLPTTDTRRVIDELLPTLPPEAGGGSTRPLTHGLLWAALGVDLPPKLSVRLTIQSPDAQAARALKDFLERPVKALAAQREVRSFLPGIDRLAEAFSPQIEGDQLTLTGKDKELMAFMQTAVRRINQAAHRRAGEESLRRLANAMHNYADAFKTRKAYRLPAVANFDKQGKPLLSWRVHLLPFLGHEKLYKEFHLDEPWDSPHNRGLLARIPDAYQGPNRKLNEEGKTIFLLPVGKDAAFKDGPEGPNIPSDFPDGTSNTILIVEADDAHAVPWTKPGDLRFDREHPRRGLGDHFGDVFLAALADGSVHLIAAGISKTTLQNAFSPADGQPLGPDW